MYIIFVVTCELNETAQARKRVDLFFSLVA
jgi:hypothetical protein